MSQLKQKKPKLLIIGKGGKKEGMGHLVRISALVETLASNYLITVLVKQDHFGEFFFKQKEINCFTYQDNRGLYRFLEKTITLHAVMGYDPGELRNHRFSSRVHIGKNIDNMAAFITEMDVGIIAGGFIKFEFMCIGTPFLLVSLCDHQQKLARKFASNGYGVYLGEIKNLIANPGKFQRKIESFLYNETMRMEMFENSRQLVDGQGSVRILEMVNSLIDNT